MSNDKKPLPTSPALIGKTVYLRPTTPDDMINIQYWVLQSEPQVRSCFPIRIKTVSEASEDFRLATKSTDHASFTIVRKKDNIPVGRITYYNYNSLNRSAAMGILVDPQERKNGFATQAIELLSEYLFKYRDLNKVYGETPEFNKEAVKLLKSLGFKQDGALRGEYVIDGDYHAKLVFSLMRYDRKL